MCESKHHPCLNASEIIDDFQKVVAFGEENNCDSFCALTRMLAKYDRELFAQLLGNKALYRLVFDFYRSWQLDGIESMLADIRTQR